MTVYCIRHGQSVANAQGWIAGQIDSPLTDRGKDMARDGAQQIADSGIEFDTIVSSPLQRARDTAEIIAKRIGVDDVQILGELAERNVGDYAGREKATFTGVDNAQIIANGGESERELIQRATTIFNWLQRQPSPPLLVTHNGFLRALRFRFDPTQRGLKSIEDVPRHENAKLYELELTA